MPEPSTPSHADTTDGRARLARNVVTSWACHFVFVACGFLMPRMVDRHVGQAALGVWDFAWSLVSYLSLTQIGVGSSVNRFVAQYRARRDFPALRRAVSSVAAVQAAAAALVVVLTFVAVEVLRAWPPALTADEAVDLARVIVLLGLALAIQTALDAFRGVTTGCHRWDLHNALNAASHAGITMAMIAALAAGGRLPSLAAITLAGTIVTEAVRVAVAYHVCPGLSVAWRDVHWAELKEVLVFGAKASAPGVARLVVVQASSLMVAAQFGAATLAFYARPLALVRSLETFGNKFAFVLTPTASSLDGLDDRDGVRELLIQTARYGAYLTLPFVATIAVLGGPIIHVWMGPAYVHEPLAVVLAIGHLIPIAQQPALTILMGVNRHGAAALASLLAAVVGLLVAWVCMMPLDLGVVGAALGVGTALTAAAVFAGRHACNTLGVSTSLYYRRTLIEPIAWTCPFAGMLIGIRVCAGTRPLLIAGSAVAACAVLALMYWRHAVPPRMRDRIIIAAGRLASSVRRARTSDVTALARRAR